MSKNYKTFDGNQSLDTVTGTEIDLDYCFWESQSYNKSYFRRKKYSGFKYYDDCNVLKFLFYHWLNKWVNLVSSQYVEPYKLHPLPVSDQILYWQPIFSKHLSDGLVKLESNVEKNYASYKSILLRAAVLTFWKRTLFAVFGIIATNVVSLSISFLVKRMLKFLNSKTFDFVEVFFLLLSIILLQIVDGLFADNFRFYIYRLICILQCIFSITVFQHNLCYRRKYFNSVEGYNSLKACNNVLHSFSPESECSKSPLFCQARRYQNRDVAPNLLILDFADIFYVSIFFESLIFIINFLSNFVYGILLMSFQIKIDIWVLYVVGLSFVLLMVSIEIFNTYIFKLIFWFRDFRISKCLNILPSLPVISKMLLDDLALNVIIDARNNELLLFMIRLFLSFFNRSLYTVCINVSFYLIKSYFVRSIDDASVITDVDTAAFMTTFYIFLRIINSMFLVPIAIKILTVAIVSFRRLNRLVSDCSPNFYISDNKFTGRLKMLSDMDNKTSGLNKDTVVLYKQASFAWITSRKEYVEKSYHHYLKNANFELKRGEIAIIAGPQGIGKSNFVKSLLGEMTLIDGSMAVVPLHTSMPIFYASQEIWLKKGTIRANITFGYKFYPDIYNKVLRAVDLEYDISRWEKGDLRVVSDNAHSLSGGQRVRMELARAVYAYLIFSQVNQEYNNGKCSFLMCLDSSFNGLDPFVSKTIFNSLFNKRNGLLVNNDLAIVLTSNFQSFDKFVGTSDARLFSQIKVYTINKRVLSFCCNFPDFVEFKNSGFIYDSTHRTTLSNETHFIDFMSKDVNVCSGTETRLGRRLVTKNKYDESFKSFIKKDFVGVKFNPYLTYIKAAGTNLVVFIVLTTMLSVMDNLKFVFATNFSDYLNMNVDDYNNGEFVDMSEIRSKSHYYKKVVFIFVIVIISLSFLSTIFMTVASITASRRFQEYAVNSIFNNTSEVLKIKRQIGHIMTYLTCDLVIIDDDIPVGLISVLVSFIYTMINIVTLFYLVPISIPFFSFTLVIIYKFVLIKSVIGTRNAQFGYFEATSHIFSAFENAITGSSIYRSYKKESELLTNVVEHDDYKLRSRFMALALRVWVSVLFNWMFSIATFIVLVVLILFDRYTRFKLKVGYFSLGLSLSMDVVKSFTNFSMTFTRFSKYMCNIYRFRAFIPETKYEFIKKINTHDESFIINNHPEFDCKVNTNVVSARRNAEFKSQNKGFLHLNKLFYRPRINLIDVTKYLSPKHSGMELKDVRVYTSMEKKDQGMILKNINASAQKAEIVGIIGRTGAGKTTLLSVLGNVARNRTGQVLLDGTDLDDIPKNVARQVIGVLPQLPFVFKGWTVRRFIDPRKLFSDDEINDALDKCGLLDFVNNLNGGKKLDSVILPEDVTASVPSANLTPLTDRNLKDYYQHSDMLLSDSQLRTMSFVRLVLYRFFYRIILVDEPPEDDSNEFSTDADPSKPSELGIPIYDLLKKYFKHCTTFIIAHDANMSRMCTTLWIMHEGQIIRICKGEDIAANESISNIIEQMINK